MLADDGFTCVVKFDNIGVVEVVQVLHKCCSLITPKHSGIKLKSGVRLQCLSG